jgi:hypothetical protein
MQGFITDAVNMTIEKWKREERLVEKNYYPKYKSSILSLVRLLCLRTTRTNYYL